MGSKKPMGYRKLNVETLESRMVLSATQIWQSVAAVDIQRDVSPQNEPIPVSDFHAVSLEESQLRSLLSNAPLEFTAEAENPLVFEMPNPDGEVERFAVVETQMMEPELAAKFPQIKTYRGIGIDNPTDTIHFDLTYNGFRAQVRGPRGTFYVDPLYHLDTSVYASFYRDNLDFTQVRQSWQEFGIDEDGEFMPDGLPHDHDHEFDSHEGLNHSHATSELDSDHDHAMDDDHHVAADHGESMGGTGESLLSTPRTGSELRMYRLAVAATGEYSNFHGGTVNSAQSAIVTAMNRVNGIYEEELTVRMILVANNDQLVFLNAGSDPYTNNNAFAMLGQNQSTIDAIIGSADYDIGHVFSTGAGGVAGFGVIGLNGSKAQGVTGINPPTGDVFWVDYVAHELGHQFGGSHTFNGNSGSCSGGNRSGGSAFEPGSGSTIMAYAGICGNDNLQNNSDDYFHSRSLDQIVGLLDGARSGVGTRMNTGNSIPTADAGPNFVIPADTPFVLTGSGNDADGDPLLYNWEQRDLGPQQDVNAGDNGSSPIFRSFAPSEDPSRFLPRINDVRRNRTTVGETYPTTTRVLDFRLMVRDLNVGAGGAVAFDNMSVSVRNVAGPFLVTSPNTSGVVWDGASTQTITWDVAGTTGSNINTSEVNILLSTDQGRTFPTMLLEATPNDGSQEIVIPNIQTSAARIMVQANGNIFYDMSNFNTRIDMVTTAPGDFNADGNLDCADVDALVNEIVSGTNDSLFDVTADGSVNQDDLEEWVVNLKGTSIGDANLDSLVNVADFDVWNANKLTVGASWCGGDFNADGVTDVSDFNLWNENRLIPAARPLASQLDRLETNRAVAAKPSVSLADSLAPTIRAAETAVAPVVAEASLPALDRMANSNRRGDQAKSNQPMSSILEAVFGEEWA